ncbi:type II toxin-antitoxin system CcdA family antitoxin [Methylobacillus sp. Pita1]
MTARQRELWKQENQAAIERYNEIVEKHGNFSDGLRRF